MKVKVLKSSVLLILLVGIASCSKKNDPVPVTKKLSYQFKVLNTTVPLTSSAHGLKTDALTLVTSIGSIKWESGYSNILAISFAGKSDNIHNDTTSADYTFIEPFVYKVDLFGGNQLLGNVDIAKGTYHDVEIKLELKSSSSEPALYLKGIYASANGGTPVVLSLSEGNDQLVILVTAKDLTVGAKDGYIAFINMHLDKLMAGVSTADLDAATVSNGSIFIDQNNNTVIYDKIKANINNFSDGDYNYTN
ncbi:MAG: hypothetical protein JWP44_2432 [Mucilaginibacter sp.]|nr:hypothetical protein [Mucilaginibacter sp.]